LFQLPRDRSARTRQLPHPRTCGPVTRGAKNTRQDRREPSPSTHPCSPRPRKVASSGKERRRDRQEGKARQAAARPTPWFPIEDTARTRALLFSRGRRPGKAGTVGGNQAGSRRDHTKSRAMSSWRLLDRGACWRSGRRAPRKEEGEGDTRQAFRCLEAGSGGRTRRGASRAAASSAPTPPCRRRCRPAAPRRRVADPLVPWVSSRCRASSSGGSVSSL